MRILIRGAGDIASGIAVRLKRCGFEIVMTELKKPTAIRRTVCFSEAVRNGKTEVEGIKAFFCGNAETALKCAEDGAVAVVIDEDGVFVKEAVFDAVVDARLAKRNIDTHMTDAPIVIGVGPGFTAGEDCHAVVETKRGHDLGRVIYKGGAAKNTGVPGNIGGYTSERLLKAPADGEFKPAVKIGDIVKAGDICAHVAGIPVKASIDGVVRGLLPEGTIVFEGMKSGDVDPRGAVSNCYSVSDKALAVAGGVLEALLALKKRLIKPLDPIIK